MREILRLHAEPIRHLHTGDGFWLVVQRHEHDSASKLVRDFRQLRNLHETRFAPIGPKVEHHHVTSELVEREYVPREQMLHLGWWRRSCATREDGQHPHCQSPMNRTHPLRNAIRRCGWNSRARGAARRMETHPPADALRPSGPSGHRAAGCPTSEVRGKPRAGGFQDGGGR